MIPELKGQSILIYDIETNGLDVLTAECKWFIAYSYKNDKTYCLPYTAMNIIQKLLKGHNKLIGFNNKNFDDLIMNNQHDSNIPHWKSIDLLNISKQRLPIMGIKTPNYKLKTIVDTLKLPGGSKGEIDYNIFKKDEWNDEEIKLIEDYGKQDIICTKSLFEWFFEQFKPLRGYLSEEDQRKFMDIKSSAASLAFRVMCNLSGNECEFKSNDTPIKTNKETFEGGHHIEPREDRATGNIVSIDIVSAYPHAIMMGNLLSRDKDGWSGGDYFDLKGSYNIKEMGKTEKALKEVFLTRLKAKQEGDKIKSLAFKIVINSFYGTLGNDTFQTFYDPVAAGDCTKMIRTIIKKLAKTCEENGFKVLYGFTDNVMVNIPEHSSKEDLMVMVNSFIKDVKKNVPFPMDTFNLEVDCEYKFIRFFAKNCYLWVDSNNKVGYKQTLLNKNTPKIIMDVFNNKMCPKIIKNLDSDFEEEEIINYIKDMLKQDVSLAGQDYNIKDKSEYKNNNSIQAQMSDKYGEGQHILIPNLKSIGVGKAKSTKKKIGVRYCTIKEFHKNKLTHNDVDISQLIKHLDKFIIKQNIRGVNNEKN